MNGWAMRVGIRVPCYRAWCKASQIRRIARAAEDFGFDSLWVQDHLVAPLGPPEEILVGGLSDWMSEAAGAKKPTTLLEYYAGGDWWLDPYSVWGFLAAVTERVTLASDIIVLPYRNPIVQAKMIGTLDVLSGGRIVLGTGTGHVRAESEVLGVDFSVRARMHDEYIRVVRRLLSGAEASFEGEFVRFGPLRTLVRTEKGTCPPILVGGNGRRAIRRAAELGDGWLPSMPDPAGLRRGIAELEAACARAGRAERPAVSLSLPSLIRLARPGAPQASRARLSPAEAAAKLNELAAQGVAEVSLGFPMPSEAVYLEQIELFAKEVLPALAT